MSYLKSEMIPVKLPDDFVFVAGTNMLGVHGSGSALEARDKYGMPKGRFIGRTSDRSYGIPTKTKPSLYRSARLPLSSIHAHVAAFKEYAKWNRDRVFYVVAIGCGLTGYTVDEIGPMFADAPDNCVLPYSFAKFFCEVPRKNRLWHLDDKVYREGERIE